jgi:ABC-2 type transport system permease protein
MFAIYKKEIKSFFNTVEGYVAIIVFFITTSIILWYIPSDYNIIYNHQASLSPFFLITPWVFLFLMPAITMKMLSTETSQKTILILLTKPIKKWGIITAKFLASVTIGLISLAPSLIFIYSIYQLSEPIGNIDTGELIGSYIGIIMLISTYSAIGLFGSIISRNTMISFVFTVMIILFFLFGVDVLSNHYNNSILEYISINTHYESISRGVIDSRDIIYFMSMTICFLGLSVLIMEKNNS